MATCEPLPGALVSLWHCNATGSYSSFTGQSPNTPFLELLDQLNVTNFTIGSTDIHTDDSTWLRGMWPTDKHGMMEMRTVFPGFYIERTIHIHTQASVDGLLCNAGVLTSLQHQRFSPIGLSARTAPSLLATGSLRASFTSMKQSSSGSWRRNRIRGILKSNARSIQTTYSSAIAPWAVITLSLILFRRMV
ncbi:Intradiol ring-cleavage dioxygenase core [Macrophomina phaseolina MS6]|uniref:Intradiol ring-cleavage dioxygenase core n=1 Tax=Macrophomina phaseolina (strain MS6) TaxID=1126212 RepID=K2RY67_MACPH|nr:Intradiol ring-cleavage dioxygenase core [Macrophomina phaseolina MS6]